MNLRVVNPTARIQREQTWRRPSPGIDQLTRSLKKYLNYQIHLLAHISELEYQIFHNIVSMFVNINNQKRKNEIKAIHVSYSAIEWGNYDVTL